MVTSVNIVDACRFFTLERLTLLPYCLKVVRNMLFQDLIVSNDLLFLYILLFLVLIKAKTIPPCVLNNKQTNACLNYIIFFILHCT